MPAARSYVEHNTRERERLRGLVERPGDDELHRPVNEHWTVAGVLGHIAGTHAPWFWPTSWSAACRSHRPTPSRRRWIGSTTPPDR